MSVMAMIGEHLMLHQEGSLGQTSPIFPWGGELEGLNGVVILLEDDEGTNSLPESGWGEVATPQTTMRREGNGLGA